MIGWIQTAYEPISKFLPKKPTALKTLFVCVGPGSYVGMRQAVSFAKALKMVNNKYNSTVTKNTSLKRPNAIKMQIIPFTIFDLFLILAKQQLLSKKVTKGQILIKAWPRHEITPQTPINNIRVYTNEFIKQGADYILANNHKLINLIDIKINSALPFITNLSQTITERLTVKKNILIPITLTEDLQTTFIPQIKPASYNLEPIYINPPSYESKKTSGINST